MARGRELLAQNVTGAKRNEIRSKKFEDGKCPCRGRRERSMC